MSVYVGESIYEFGRMVMCHMVADSRVELHEMADAIGIDRRHFQSKSSMPHYDISKSKRKIAVEKGAVEVTEREIVEMVRKRREK